MKRSLYLLFSILTLTLGGCSAIDFVYNNAPDFVASEFEDAFDLDQVQMAQLEPRLQAFFAWHREQELPRYRALLDRAAADAADGLSSEEFLGLRRSFSEAWRRSSERMIEDVGDLASTLQPQQVARFQQYFRESSEEHDEYLAMPAEQRRIYRAWRNLERLESWFGSFDPQLEARILERLQQLPDTYVSWIEYREAQHLALVRLLNQASDNTEIKADLKQVLLAESTDYARNFEPQRAVFWQAYSDALVDISRWTPEAQRKKAIDRLQSYARVASRLSRDS